jgi:hypothetical protein
MTCADNDSGTAQERVSRKKQNQPHTEAAANEHLSSPGREQQQEVPPGSRRREDLHSMVRSPQANAGDHVEIGHGKGTVQEPHERADVGAVMRSASIVPADEL